MGAVTDPVPGAVTTPVMSPAPLGNRSRTTGVRLYLRALRALWRLGLVRVWPWTAFLIWRAWRRCPGTLAFLADVAAMRAGARVALVDDDGPLSFDELRARYQGLACELVARFSAGPGCQIAIIGHNHRSVVIALLAATRTGADVVLVNPDSPPTVLAKVLASSALASAPVPAPATAPSTPAAAPSSVVPLLPILLHSPEIDLAQVLPNAPRLALHADVGMGLEATSLPTLKRPGHLCVLTAGSTGLPKRVRRRPSVAALLPVLLGLLDDLPIAMHRPTVLALPIFHGHGLATLATAIAFAAPVYLGRRHAIAPLLARSPSPTQAVVVSVPTLLSRWLATGPQKVAAVLTGSAPLAPQLCRALLESLGPVVYNLYGSTEAGVVSLATPAMLTCAPSTVGKALPGTHIRILDHKGAAAAAGEVGRIHVRGPLVCHAGGQGWLDTGDLGRMDQAGYLHLCGRADGMFISGGENVYPQQVEAHLLEHPAVAEAAIAVVADADFGARMRAFVVVRPLAQAEAPLTPEILRDWLRQRLDRHQQPRSIEIVSALPRNALGKIDRAALARAI